MIKQADQLNFDVLTEMRGGKGEVKIIKLLENDEFHGKGRLFARNVIKPGCSIGFHQHAGDFETYYVISGEGLVDDNGVKAVVKAGDVVYTNVGESHSIENTGTADLEVIALILYA